MFNVSIFFKKVIILADSTTSNGTHDGHGYLSMCPNHVGVWKFWMNLVQNEVPECSYPCRRGSDIGYWGENVKWRVRVI